jgi:regulator of protease activity HflC (stomatin/prohibitin superfamily)
MADVFVWVLNTIGIVGVVVVVLGIVLLPAAIRILPAWERAVVLRLGKFNRVTGPGVIVLIPYVDSAIRVNTRIMTMDVPRPQYRRLHTHDFADRPDHTAEHDRPDRAR